MKPLAREYHQIYWDIAEEDTNSGSPKWQSPEDLQKKAIADLARIGDISGKNVLEVGPGWGALSLEMEARGAKVSSADIVPQYIRMIQPKVSGSALLMDIQESPLKGKYDLVVMCDVLEHLFRPADALLGAFDALVPGGLIYVRCPAHESLMNYAENLGCPFEVVHLRTYSRDMLKRELLASGFTPLASSTKASANRTPRNLVARSWFWEVQRSQLVSAWNPEEVSASGPGEVSTPRKLLYYLLQGAQVSDRHRTTSRMLNVLARPFSRPGEIAMLARRP